MVVRHSREEPNKTVEVYEVSETRVHVAVKATIKIGDNFVSVDAGIETDRLEGENPREALDRVYSVVDGFVDEKIKENVANN